MSDSEELLRKKTMRSSLRIVRTFGSMPTSVIVIILLLLSAGEREEEISSEWANDAIVTVAVRTRLKRVAFMPEMYRVVVARANEK